MTAPSVVLLLIAHHDAPIWAERLREASFVVVTDPAGCASAGEIDVLVTDEGSDHAAVPDELARLEPARLHVGGEAPCDFRLPADTTARELVIACRLLARIACQRREDRLRQQALANWYDLAHTDPLSGLPNRRAWIRELPRRLARQQPLCLTLVDLDRLKQINQQRGHDQGDRVLRNTARRLRRAVRETDFAGRLGGDEFGLLLAEVPPERAREVVERVRCSLRHDVTGVGTVTASAGFAIAGPCWDADQLLAAADEALRDAKLAGRDCTRPV